MPTYTLQIPQVGLANSTEDPKIASSLTTLQTAVNAGLDTSNLSPSAGVLLTQLAAGVARFTAITTGSNTTLADGQCVTTSTAPLTLTLPVAAAGAWCAVIPSGNPTGANPITIQRQGSDVIYGPGFTAGVTSLAQGTGDASLVFYANATLSWTLLAGQQDSGWVSLPLGTNVTTTSPPNAFTAAARLVGDTVRLRGWLKATASITGGSTWTTMPAGMRPTANVNFVSGTNALSQTNTVNYFSVVATTGVTGAQFNAVTNDIWFLDGLSFTVS